MSRVPRAPFLVLASYCFSRIANLIVSNSTASRFAWSGVSSTSGDRTLAQCRIVRVDRNGLFQRSENQNDDAGTFPLSSSDSKMLSSERDLGFAALEHNYGEGVGVGPDDVGSGLKISLTE